MDRVRGDYHLPTDNGPLVPRHISVASKLESKDRIMITIESRTFELSD